MTEEQLVPALMAALIGEGVSVEQVERAVAAVRGCPLGTSIAALSKRPDDTLPMVRAFTHEQYRLLRWGT